MESSSLENWDGRLSTSENKITQDITIAGPRTLKDQSNPPATSSEPFEANNDVLKALSDETIHLTGIEGSRNLGNATSIHGLEENHFSQIMGPRPLMNIPSSALTVPITPRKEVHDASNDASPTTRKFMPADSPLLRAFHEYNASPSNTNLAQRLEAAISGTPLPRAKSVIDTISLHSTDAEGEDEDETDDIFVAESLLQIFSPQRPASRSHADARPATPSEHNSLFTPPPVGEQSAEFLFTPPSSRASPPRKPVASSSKTGLVMSHVEVPPCPSKASYKLLSFDPSKKKSRASSQPFKIHTSLGEALQASMSHNDSIGVIAREKGPRKNKKEKKDSSWPFVNNVPGPSKPSVSHNIPTKKKKRNVDDEQLSEPKKKRKTVHVDIDLTLSDDEKRIADLKPEKKVLHPKAKPLAKRKSNDAKVLDSQQVVVGVVKPLPVDVWSLNTRFMRREVKKSNIPLPLPKKKQKGPSRRRTPGFLPLSSSPQSEEDDDEVSLGDPIPTSWREDFDDDEMFDDDAPIVLPNPLPDAQQSSQPSSTPSTTPKSAVSRKIDLAAIYRKKDKLKAKNGPPKSPAKSSPNRLGHSTSNTSVVGLATPSVSQSQIIPSSNNHSPESNREHELEEPSVPVTPSAKALGKRRAHSPPPFIVPSQSAASSSPTHIGNREFDNFIHNYSVSSPNPQPYVNGLTLSARYSPAVVQPSSILPLYPPESALDLGPGSESFPTMNGIDSFELQLQAQQTPFWSSLEGSITEYQYTTVDPTLLGGTPMPVEEPSEPEPEDLTHDTTTNGFGDQLVDYDSSSDIEEAPEPVAGPSVVRNHPSSKEHSPSASVSSSSSSNSAPSSENPYTPIVDPASKQQATSSTMWKMRVSRSQSTFVYEEQEQQPQERSESEYLPSIPSPKRDVMQHSKDRQASSTSFEDPEVLSEMGYAPSTTSNYEPPSAVGGGGKGKGKGKQSEEPSTEGVRTLPKRQRFQRQRTDMVDLDEYLNSTDPKVVKLKKKEKEQEVKVKAPGPKLTRHDWPTGGEPSYCHQCRTKSGILKMNCLTCKALYCFRCMTYRYPDEEFVKKRNSCPRCKSYCNCTACCLKRGEQYVSTRYTKPPPKHPLPPPAVPVVYDTTALRDMVMPKDVEYFGTVYDLNGKRIAVTFAPSGGEEGSTPAVVFAQGTGNKLSEIQKTTRVFVGKVQRCWGLGRDAIVKEVRPMAKPKKAQKNGVVRTFVGRTDFLRFPKSTPEDEDEDDDDLEGDLSSLTSLTDSEEETRAHEDEKPSTAVPTDLKMPTSPVPYSSPSVPAV